MQAVAHREETGVAERRAALGGLWDAHAGGARRLLAAFGLRGDGLDDALQEVFVRLGAALARLDAPASRAFVYGVARHVAVDATTRARKVEGLGVRDPVDGGRAAGDPAGRAEERELAGLVRAAAAELEPELQAALHLRHLNELTMEELAAALECSVPTARARLVSAAHLLAAALRRRGVVPGGGP
jgi:RNA polymerase sigma-70 factor (ECF subfamily)